MIFFRYILPLLIAIIMARGTIQSAQRDLRARNIQYPYDRRFMRLAYAKTITQFIFIISFFAEAFSKNNHGKSLIAIIVLIVALFGSLFFEDWYTDRVNKVTTNCQRHVPIRSRKSYLVITAGILGAFGVGYLRHWSERMNSTNAVNLLIANTCVLLVFGVALRILTRNKKW